MLADDDVPLLDELLHRLLALERDEPEAFPELGFLVDGHLEVGDFAELAEELLQHLVGQLRLEAADENLA